MFTNTGKSYYNDHGVQSSSLNLFIFYHLHKCWKEIEIVNKNEKKQDYTGQIKPSFSAWRDRFRRTGSHIYGIPRLFFPRHVLCLAIDSSQHNRPVETFLNFCRVHCKLHFEISVKTETKRKMTRSGSSTHLPNLASYSM